MSDHARNSDDDVFTERVARILRAPESFEGGFEEELVSAIHEDRPPRFRATSRARRFTLGWWIQPKSIRVSPVVGLGVAASFALLAVLGATRERATTRALVQAPVVQAKHDTVTYVRFVFVGAAKSVSLVADFNAWGATPTPLTTDGVKGAWSTSVPVPKGRHEYAFIVDGKRWVADPFAPSSTDDFDTNSSIITVGG